MVELDTREWLLTNGNGSFASGTVSDVRTRTYHGWLFAATSPPSGRTLLLSHLEASLELANKVVALGTNFWGTGSVTPNGYQRLRSFDINPVPKWIWGEDNWQLSRQLIMPYGWSGGDEKDEGETVSLSPYLPLTSPFSHCTLIQYRYEGKETAILKLRLLIADRDFHHQQRQTSDLKFSQQKFDQESMLSQQGLVCLQAINSGKFGTLWYLRWTRGNYQPDEDWYWNYSLPEETQRGLGDREDLFSPGYLTVVMQPGDTVTLEARVGSPSLAQTPLTCETFAEAVEAELNRLCQVFGKEQKVQGQNNSKSLTANCVSVASQEDILLWPTPYSPLPIPYSQVRQQLLRATDQFVVNRASIAGSTVIAGYHWFNDRGRDTLIALPGLALATGRFQLAKALLYNFGRYCRYGLIPNSFPDVGDEPSYNSIDAALWWIEALGLYLEATQDWEFLKEQYPVVQQIYKAFIGGTRYNIQADAIDGLISWDARGVALTWMNVLIDGQAITPRLGKPIEINALWYSALCWASRWAEILSEYEQACADSVRLAKQATRYTLQAQQVQESLQKFWNPQLGYLYDTIEPDDRRNSQIRPNAVLALSLRHCGFPEQQGRLILQRAKSSLLTPYGLRSLDPNDPEYVGRYVGNSLQRDRVYHQGTVWSWLIGPFIRAWKRFYGSEPLPFDWEPLVQHFLSSACIGSISEMFDGDYPHTPRGAIAQALSIAEVIRHFDC